jgi:formylglycine-generating enzyme
MARRWTDHRNMDAVVPACDARGRPRACPAPRVGGDAADPRPRRAARWRGVRPLLLAGATLVGCGVGVVSPVHPDAGSDAWDAAADTVDGPISGDGTVADDGTHSDAAGWDGADAETPLMDASGGEDGGGATCGTMVEVPAGPFFMGCNGAVDQGCYQKERPGHEVTLSAFWIDACEVTTAEYRACVTAGACTVPANPCVTPSDCTTPKMCNYHTAGRDAHPINCVMWGQADAYCSWIGKRLPTEAEWEKAARGTDGRLYPWGNEPLPSCVTTVMDGDGSGVPGGEGCGTGGTELGGAHPAGASPYGAQDMLGNVWEWVSDWYAADYYATSPTADPPGPATGTTKSFRGGGWTDVQGRFLRISFRTDETLHYKRNVLGFRCAR